ncbi:MAG: hypothetical protein ACXVXO_11895 [Mycobacteriaceae bacterium]
MKAYDAAYAPSLATVRQAGGVAVNHYLTGIYAGSSTQPRLARAAGLGCILTYEQGPSELVGTSRAYGRMVGQRAVTAAVAAGAPADGSVAIFFSVDVNVANAGDCDQAFLGIRDACAGKFQVRAYAQGSVIDHLAAAGITGGKGWLAAPTSWPGFNPSSPNVCLVQRVGTDVPGTDLNDITDINALGAWWPDGSPYGDDMTPDECRAVVRDELNYALGFLAVGGNSHYGGATNLPSGGGVKVDLQALATALAPLVAAAVVKQLPAGSAPVPTKFTGTVDLQAQ